MAVFQASVQDTIKAAAQMIGIETVKPKQVQAVEAFVDGRAVFVSLPTGYGKSVIYSVLPGTFDLIRGMYIVRHSEHAHL